MPQHALDSFLRVFARIPQRVVWKWETGRAANVTPNVLLIDWLPQQDLLGICSINYDLRAMY